ncbi:NAD(P)H-binding protein [Candidatus Nitrosopelagicus sp.]|nr:NAD(P)H-binding protein [Candidatus Nitrosopelagicus sp.]
MSQKLEITNFKQTKPYSILVTGATGFIGSKLVDRLTSSGYTVKAMSRRPVSDIPGVKFVKADALIDGGLENALTGVEVAYYLLHSMEGHKKEWENFDKRESIQAENFLKAATKAGVKRIIYLGGLVNDGLELSRHMKSRKVVGDILSSGNIPVTQLRASIIIGAQGGSFAMLRYLVERLRVMVCPKWVKSLAQPICLDDVVEYLARCMDIQETSGKIFDIGGPEKVNYEQMMRIYSAILNRNLFVLQIPFLTTKLSSYWIDLVTPVKASLARPLVESLIHDSVVHDESINKYINFELKSLHESIIIAQEDMLEIEEKNKNYKFSEKIGFPINQKLLSVSLILMAIIGTTYYWLDNRQDVFEITWLIGSIVWFVAIGFGILFVMQKTRLGYLIAGLLSWVTIAFWLFDNFYVIFDMSLIAQEPNIFMTIRNFLGVTVAGLAVFSSHNVFHKIRTYQTKGKKI